MEAESPTAATIFWAAAADGTSKATINRSRGSVMAESVERFGLVGQGSAHFGHHLRVDDVQADALQAPALKVQGPCRAVRKINYAPRDNRPAVIDSDDDCAAIPHIRDLDQGSQRKPGMGCGYGL